MPPRAPSALTFYTERLTCRLLQEQDKDGYCALYTDDKVMRKIADPVSPQQAQKQFASTLKCNQQYLDGADPVYLAWGIFDKNDNFMGIQGFTFEKDQPCKVEIGLMLNQGACGKLIPFEGGGALVDFGLKALKLSQIYAYFSPQNYPIQRLLTKLGFEIDDVLHQRHGTSNRYGYINSRLWQISPQPGAGPICRPA